MAVSHAEDSILHGLNMIETQLRNVIQRLTGVKSLSTVHPGPETDAINHPFGNGLDLLKW